MTLRTAQDNAYTSACMSRPAHAFCSVVMNDPPMLHGIVNYPRRIVSSGGYPIIEGGKVAGGIGIPGGHYSRHGRRPAGLAAGGAPVG